MPKKTSPSNDKPNARRETAKVLVAVFVDRAVHEWLLKFGHDYAGEINRILRAEMRRMG